MKPRIFISHAWEDKIVVRSVEDKLKSWGIDVWVDHSEIRGGENLPERISNALGWCSTVLLVWSEAASKSHWVKIEWTSAISLKKEIIPCRLDETELPPILTNTSYLNFHDFDKGIAQLPRALKLVERLKLRSHPILDKFSEDDVSNMLKEKNFFDKERHWMGKGVHHEYEEVECNREKLVIDHTTGLTWQQSGSEDVWFLGKAGDITENVDRIAETNIVLLNKKNYAGYDNWRLPTLEEAMSLMEPQTYDELHIKPIFDKKQRVILTADRWSAFRAWVVYFDYGSCFDDLVGSDLYIRAVR